MMISVDLFSAIGLVVLAFLVAISYRLRVRRHGSIHFERVEQHGSSFLLPGNVMETGYWFFQILAGHLVQLKITPNQISWGSVFLGVLAGGFFALGCFGIGAVLASVAAGMDALDGMVARMTGLGSDFGEILDSALDRYVEFFLLGGVALYYHKSPLLLALSLLAMVGGFMVSYSSAKGEAMGVELPKGSLRRPERMFCLVVGATLTPLAAVEFPMIVALILLAALGNYSAMDRFRRLAKYCSEQRRFFTALEQGQESRK